MPVRALLCPLAACALGPCGGGEFSGEPSVPDGWRTFTTAGLPFAHPGDWLAGERFRSLAGQRRIVVREVNDGKIDADDGVEIPGAKEALRLATTAPPGRGTDPVEVRSDSLDVLREGGDVVVLIAASPQRDGQALDTAAVIESLRLDPRN